MCVAASVVNKFHSCAFSFALRLATCTLRNPFFVLVVPTGPSQRITTTVSGAGAHVAHHMGPAPAVLKTWTHALC